MIDFGKAMNFGVKDYKKHVVTERYPEWRS